MRYTVTLRNKTERAIFTNGMTEGGDENLQQWRRRTDGSHRRSTTPRRSVSRPPHTIQASEPAQHPPVTPRSAVKSTRIHNRVQFYSTAKRRDAYQPHAINSRDVNLGASGGLIGLEQTSDPRTHLTLGTQESLFPLSPDFAHGRSSRRDERPYAQAEIALKTRRERRKMRQHKQQRFFIVVAASIVLIVVAAAFAWMQHSQSIAHKRVAKTTTASVVQASGEPFQQISTSSAPSATGAVKNVSTVEAAAASSKEVTGLPTPIVASYNNIPIHLSVRVADLTEVGFHAASFNYTLPFTTTLTEATNAQVQKNKGTGRDKSAQEEGANAVLSGQFIRMGRSGRGGISPMTAMDEGARANTTVYAPISGTITAIHRYNYEAGCKDYELHIRLDEAPSIEAVMIHIHKPHVKVGQHITGGITPLATIRDLTPYVVNQLSEYTGEKGNHVHVQLVNTKNKEYIKRQKENETDGYYIVADKK